VSRPPFYTCLFRSACSGQRSRRIEQFLPMADGLQGIWADRSLTERCACDLIEPERMSELATKGSGRTILSLGRIRQNSSMFFGN
jgi:hypothetical protein